VLRSDAWLKLDAAGFAALLTALTTEDLRPDTRIQARVSGKVTAALQQVRPIARALRAAQGRHRVEMPIRLNDAACGLTQLWAGGAEWEAVAGAAEMDEGDIVHLIRRLLDLLRQIPAAPGAPERLVDLATAAARAVDRPPVNEVI
jgi:superfamily II RNA helicase